MPFAKGARFQPSLACLPGTREAILNRLVDWVTGGEDQPRICLLTGLAGTGKSAIANSLAMIFEKTGQLGSSFCFKRGDNNRSLPFYFPTLINDIAAIDSEVKIALGEVVNNNRALRNSEDIQEQFSRLITGVLTRSRMSGPILLVIDALDECEGIYGRSAFFQLLSSELFQVFPPNFYLFITSRPETDILSYFSNRPTIKILELHKQEDKPSLSKDIKRFIEDQLLHKLSPPLQGISSIHCKQLADQAEGLFQWAATACNIVIQGGIRGGVPLEAFNQVMKVSSNELASIYTTALESNINVQNPRVSRSFQIIMTMILGAYEPLSKASLEFLVEYAFEKEDNTIVEAILPWISSLFNGVLGDENQVITPIHTSVREYFLNQDQSRLFHVDLSLVPQVFLIGTLRILTQQLHFNMCNLETSFLRNKDISDIDRRIAEYISPMLEYSCKFFALHLQCSNNISKEIHTLLKIFLKYKMLFWLEVLSLLRIVKDASKALELVGNYIKVESN